jgi:hypothetical protein
MRSTRARLLALAAAAALPLIALAACSDTPFQPRTAAVARDADVGFTSDSIALVKVGSLYALTVTHPCASDAPNGLLDTMQPFGAQAAPVGETAMLRNTGGGTNPCGCPATVPPPSRIPGWTCTLVTWECAPGSGVTSCSYSCSPPSRATF